MRIECSFRNVVTSFHGSIYVLEKNLYACIRRIHMENLWYKTDKNAKFLWKIWTNVPDIGFKVKVLYTDMRKISSSPKRNIISNSSVVLRCRYGITMIVKQYVLSFSNAFALTNLYYDGVRSIRLIIGSITWWYFNCNLW